MAETRTYRGRTVINARGGISPGAVLTGVVVAFGAMFLLSALVGGVLTAMGISAADVTGEQAVQAGIGAGIVLVIAQFLSYLWGGYTAGRMGRGAGVANGMLVPFVAIVIAILVGAVVAALGATANLNLPYATNRLPLENDFLVDWGVGISLAALLAMLVGGALGGGLGSRWHAKLEERTLADAPVEERPVATTDRPATAPPVTRTPEGTATAPRAPGTATTPTHTDGTTVRH